MHPLTRMIVEKANELGVDIRYDDNNPERIYLGYPPKLDSGYTIYVEYGNICTEFEENIKGFLDPTIIHVVNYAHEIKTHGETSWMK